MRYAILGIMGGFFVAFASPAAAPAAYPQLSLATSTDLSYNWSGYVAQGGTYSGVSGRWIVPAVAAGQGTAADAAWVGLGGVQRDDLLQAGTQAIVDRHGKVTYQAWVEAMPQASVPLPIAITPGDEVAVDIHRTSPGRYSVSIEDATTGAHYATEVAYASSESSAEWVEEMPALPSGNFIPLSNFGSVRFLSASTTVQGRALSAAAAGATPLTMINHLGEPLAQTSVLSQTGGFIVGRTAAQPTLEGSAPRYAPHRGTYR